MSRNFKDKIIGIGKGRSGTSYFFSTLNRILIADGEEDREHFGEPFLTRSPGVFSIDRFGNPQVSPNNYRKGHKVSDSIHYNNLYYDVTRKHENELLDALIHSKKRYTCKILTHQIPDLRMSKFIELLNHKDTTKIFIYRLSVSDSVMSLFFAIKTNIWVSDKPVSLDDIVFEYIPEKHEKFIRRAFHNTLVLFSLYKSFDWDYVVCYDDLMEDPVKDFSKWFDEETIRKALSKDIIKKSNTKEEKISKFINYEYFLNEVEKIAEEYEFPVDLSEVIK